MRPSSAKIYKILFATTGDCDSGALNSVVAIVDPSVGKSCEGFVRGCEEGDFATIQKELDVRR